MGMGGAGSGGAGSGGGAGGLGAGGTGGSGPPSDPCAFGHDALVDVSDGATLAAALAAAAPGTLIRLAPGTYAGHFASKISGSAAKPIIVCGPRTAVLDGGSTKTGYTLHVEADHGIFSGFTVTRGKKGIMLDGANHNLLRDLSVHEIGDEGIHFRTFSSNNTLQASEIHDTGIESPGFGEGVYLGSSVNNWPTITGAADKPDTSDGNKVLDNTIGPSVRAENIDIKEGTTGGEIRGNTFDGSGLTLINSDDSWVDVKGNGYTITENKGSHTLKDGFQTHVLVTGWGNDNVFHKNVADVETAGLGFNVAKKSTGNVVGCDNTVTGASATLTNVVCAP
jgi:hypothetical protein